MAASPPGPSLIKSLRERGLVLPIAVIVLIAIVLAHGYLTRDPATDSSETRTATRPEPTPTPYRPALEKIPLTYFSDYWLQLGERSHQLLVTLGEAQLPGVRVSPGYAISTLAAADALTAAAGDTPEGQLVAVNGKLNLALFRLAEDVGSERLPTADSLHAGSWLGAVTTDVERGIRVAPGQLVSTPLPGAQRLEVSIAFPSSFDVAAVVDLDSRLAGVALRGPHGVQVLTAEAAHAIVQGLASSPSCRAVDVVPLPDAVREALRLTDGVVVESVTSEAFTTPPDLRPGDILLQLGPTRVGSPEEFAEAWDSQEPGQGARLLISRGSRRIVRRAEIPGRDCRPDSATPRELPLLGAVVQWAPGDDDPAGLDAGLRLLHVPAGSRAAAAGLARGDLLVTLDGNPLAWPDSRRLLEPWTSQHVPVLGIRRGAAVRLVVLPELDSGEEE